MVLHSNHVALRLTMPATTHQTMAVPMASCTLSRNVVVFHMTPTQYVFPWVQVEIYNSFLTTISFSTSVSAGSFAPRPTLWGVVMLVTPVPNTDASMEVWCKFNGGMSREWVWCELVEDLFMDLRCLGSFILVLFHLNFFSWSSICWVTGWLHYNSLNWGGWIGQNIGEWREYGFEGSPYLSNNGTALMVSLFIWLDIIQYDNHND